MNKDIYPFEAKRYRRLSMLYRLLFKLTGIKRGKKSIVDSYYNNEIDDKSVLLLGLGKNVLGNLWYILDEMNKSKDFEGFSLFVRTDAKTTDKAVKKLIENNGWERTRTVPSGYGDKLESCKFLLTETYFPYEWTPKPGQVLINIWHGTPLKNLGIKKHGAKAHRNSSQHKNFLAASYLLYPNEYARGVMWESYRITSILKAKALMLGYPRTGGMLGISGGRMNELRRILAPENEKVIVYMPTFRGWIKGEKAFRREKEFLDYMDKELSGGEIMYVHLHHRLKDNMPMDGYSHIRTFPDIADSYEILAASDVLISDYSSVFFDYLASGKQIILYIDDIDEYVKKQGLNIDVRTLPFDMSEKKEDIPGFIAKGKDYDDSELRKEICSFDSKENAKKLCRLFLGEEDGLDIQEIPGNGKKKVLLYKEAVRSEDDICHLKTIKDSFGPDEHEVYIGFDEAKTEKTRKAASPFLKDVLQISSMGDPCLSSVGQTVLRRYKEGKMTFSNAMRLLEYEYALMYDRMYGKAEFDSLVIYDTLDPELIIGLALSRVKEKTIILSKQMKELIERGEDRFFNDAIRFAGTYVSFTDYEDMIH